MKSLLLTAVQFICLGYILLTNSWISAQPVLAGVQVAGVLLGVWAILVMSRSKLNITPDPRKGAILIQTGPYSLIRHPMYTSLMLALFPILYTDHGIANLIVFGVLFINLLLKLKYEERLLLARFESYRQMVSTTWRLIPWIY